MIGLLLKVILSVSCVVVIICAWKPIPISLTVSFIGLTTLFIGILGLLYL